LTDAERAVDLAPNLGIAHVTLGNVLLDRWDFAGAAREYGRARELAPGDAYQNRRWAVFQSDLGHKAEAVAAAERGAQLDPLSKGMYMDLASVLTFSGRPDDALAAVHHAEQMGLTGLRVSNQLAQITLQKGDFKAAREACAGERNWFENYCLALADHGLGKMADAEAELVKLRAIMGDDGAAQYVDIYAQWGRPADALYWLERAYQTRDDGPIDMKVNFNLDPIRNTPRFKEVEQKMNFPP
jgi:tetratricopeptide (TPR) repeat protein